MIFTLYSDRDYLQIDRKNREDRENSVIQIPIITALPQWLNRLFRRADDTKPKFISSIIDYRNLMPFFPELMKMLS